MMYGQKVLKMVNYGGYDLYYITDNLYYFKDKDEDKRSSKRQTVMVNII